MTDKKTVRKKKQPAKKAVERPAEEDMLQDDLEEYAEAEGDERLFWVGIGASAGGLEALRSFVSQIPKQGVNNITYIAAQHLSPKHRSMLVELLSRETNMQVQELEDGQRPEANVMYITPPDRDVFVEKGRLRMSVPASEYGPKPSVDYFFTTLAEDQGDHAIGIILSGTGSDGSHGVRAIRAAGGITMSQDTDSAKFDGMPSNAIETGCIDLIMPPSEMGQEIAKIVKSPRTLKLLQEETQRTDIQELLYLLKSRSGVDFKDYKTGTLYRRINRRIAACSVGDLDEYLSYVQENPAELDELYGDILISVTNFFRDPEAFEKLRGSVEAIIKEKKTGDPIRIWVPGCATGEEAYTLVILFAEVAGGLAKLRNFNFQLFATDLDSDILARARRGTYAETTLQMVDQSIRDKYFRSRDSSYEIIPAVRDLVVFSRHNVFEDPPFLRLDLISCRNLLIYFNVKLQQIVMGVFHYALNPYGTLFLGKSESLGQSINLFQSTDSKANIFKRKLLASADQDKVLKSTYSGVKRVESPINIRSNKTMHDLPDAMVKALAPNSLLVDEAMDIVRIYGDVQQYTQLSPGSASMNLMAVSRKEFRQELRAMVYKVLRERAAETTLPKRIRVRGEDKQVNIVIRPLEVTGASETLLLISFEESEAKVVPPVDTTEAAKENPLLAELEQELYSTREHLQTVVEELETSNEELQSTNEELQSSNEELQSSNEELETANEELQSTNEELLTVNDELQTKTYELSTTNDALFNVKESLDFPVLAVDRSLVVKLFNKAAKEIFALTDDGAHDIITSVGSFIDVPLLRQKIENVIQSGTPSARQLGNDEVSYIERILPYRDAHTQIEGAVLTYQNNSSEREAQDKLAASRKRYELAVKGSSAGIWDWDVAEDVLYCSDMLLTILHTTQDRFVPTFDFLRDRVHPDDVDDVSAILNAHLEKGFEFNVECRMRRGHANQPTGSELSRNDYAWVHLRGQAVWDDQNKAVRMAGSLNDVTERRLMLEQLRESNQALGRFAYVCSHDLKEPARLTMNFSELLASEYADKLDDQGRQYIDYIGTSAERMQDMIQDMLAYSLVDSKGPELTKVNCNDQLEKVISDLHIAIKEKNAQVTFGDLPDLKADEVQVYQLFQNLVGNGIKFCDQNPPKVHVDVIEDGDFWRFSVKDNGIGLKEEYASQIFDVFQQLNKTENYPGTGIGLSICQKIVARYGGKIWVKSKLGKGSTFFFTLPKKFSGRGVNSASN